MAQAEHTFAFEVKSEIVHNKGLISRHKRAFTYGMLLCGKAFSAEGISLRTEHPGVARLYAKLIFSLVAMRTSVTTKEHSGAFDHGTFVATVDDIEDRLSILSYFGKEPGGEQINTSLFTQAEDKFAFFAGAFLACSNISDPFKDYHLEFVVHEAWLASELTALLESCSMNFKCSTRRGQQVVYCKDSKSIEDMLTMMGATNAMMSMVNVKIVKEVRNKVNRATNCETSNIEKTVSAAIVQAADIRYLKQAGLFDTLEPALKETALARIRHPDLSLRELGAILGISRSGLNHRFHKISEIARLSKS